jgi:putative hydrolase of the HAD superfamily
MNGCGSVRLVSFDVGGTLIHSHPSVGAVYAEVLNRRGFRCEAEEVGAAFEVAWEEAAGRLPPGRERYIASERGERGYWRDLLERTVRHLGGGAAPAGAAEELFERFGHRETWRVYPEVVPTLKAIAGRGIPMTVISNWDSRLPGLLEELDLRRYFGTVLVSALEGLEKPDPRLFRRAAELASVRPEEVLHVGDRIREDLEGAREAGCRALQVVRNGDGGPGIRPVLEYLVD